MQYFIHKRYEEKVVTEIIGLYNLLLGTLVISFLLIDIVAGWAAGIVIIVSATRSGLIRLAIVTILLLALTL